MDAIVLLIKIRHLDHIIDSNRQQYEYYLKKYQSYDFHFPRLDLESHRMHIRNFVVLSTDRDEHIKNGL